MNFITASSEAAKADELNREMERAGSWGRNLQFQASDLGKRITILEASAGLADGADGIEQATAIYQERLGTLEAASASVNDTEQRLAEADLRVAQSNASVSALRITYSDAFNSLLKDTSSPRNHPLEQEALQAASCPICHTVETPPQTLSCDHREHPRKAQHKSRSDRGPRRAPVRQDSIMPLSTHQ
jgi:hypothetical protein